MRPTESGEGEGTVLNFRAPTPLVEALRAKAKREDRSMSAVIRLACEAAVGRDAKRGNAE